MSNIIETRAKKPNPRATSNFISSIFLLYMVPIFYSSFKKQLTAEDLFEPLNEHKSRILGEKLENAWKRCQKKYSKWSLHIAILQVLGGEFLMLGVLAIIKELISIIFVPYLIIKLVSFFGQTTEEITIEEAYYYAGGLIITKMAELVVAHPMFFWSMHLGMKARVACNALIYRKMLRLSKTALGETTVGHIVNLTSNDVGKFDVNLPLLHYVWVSPIQAAIGMYFLYLEIGVSSFFGVAFLVILIPLQSYIAKQTMVLRLKTALRTDERVRLMNEIISGIQIIKMYVWENSFAKLVAYVRRKELQAIRVTKYMRALTYAVESAGSRIAIFISLVGFALMGNQVSAQTAFGVTAIYNVLKTTFSFLFTMGLSGVAEVNVSLNRIKKFMDSEEIVNQNLISSNSQLVLPSIIFKEVYAKWISNQTDLTLTNLTFQIDKPQLFAVIGPVGAGKSSLLNAILSEISTTGNIEISGKISYCSQEPWLFSASIRENILFGADLDEKRYRKVCKICALESDFKQFPHEDKTLVGEKGRALSGGQKARINLARCVYRQADIYLLDDPLSAVDANVGQMLFHQCIKGYLKNKIVVLITHQLQYLMDADQILILNDGKMSGLGTYEDLQTSGLDFAKLLNVNLENHENEKSAGRNRLLSTQSSIVSDKSEEMEDNNEENHLDNPMIEKEKMSSGAVTFETFKKYLKSGESWVLLIMAAASYILFEALCRIGDYFLVYWVNYEDKMFKMNISDSTAEMNNFTESNLNVTENSVLSEDRMLFVYEYSGIMALTILLVVLCNILGFNYLIRISNNLHNYIFRQLLKAKMQFFNTNPVGRILNKFSSDMGIIDDILSTIFIEVIRTAMLLFGTLILTSVVNVTLLPAAIILLAIFYLMRVVYVATSRNVKRIEAIARSPIYNQMTTSLNGLSTIRALLAQEMVKQQFDEYQDLHSSAWFLFISSTRAFGFWLDIICAIFLAIVIILMLALTEALHGATLGLIITQYMGLMGALQWGMRQWSELENQMVSVERVLEYTKLDNEPERIAITLSESWPTGGKLEFRNVTMRYNEEDPPILRNLQFVINKGERIGIIGRTGAGKSSIINALFQLNYISGEIFIDDENATELPLDLVRSKISIIPQESILFSGTLRKNLDPFNEYNDDVLWNALELVELKEIISEMPSGLHAMVAESGANFSVGQRQLICLARAIIRNNCILVLDEATANVDPHTDSLIQDTIRKHFVNCTVLTIAHRLNTIMDSDRILVMDAGQMVDFDSPHNLLQTKSGIFTELVKTSGLDISKILNPKT